MIKRRNAVCHYITFAICAGASPARIGAVVAAVKPGSELHCLYGKGTLLFKTRLTQCVVLHIRPVGARLRRNLATKELRMGCGTRLRRWNTHIQTRTPQFFHLKSLRRVHAVSHHGPAGCNQGKKSHLGEARCTTEALAAEPLLYCSSLALVQLSIFRPSSPSTGARGCRCCCRCRCRSALGARPNARNHGRRCSSCIPSEPCHGGRNLTRYDRSRPCE